MSTAKYRQKRNFAHTPEPYGAPRRSSSTGRRRIFVIQKHRASRLHYDFRLEFGGVLVSWAIPKGPSLDPSVKRLARQVEDHPLGYARFEGAIPEGEYGGGTVMIWDRGTWVAETDSIGAALRKGNLKFTLRGKKVRGCWALVRSGGSGNRGDKVWLLIKHRDRFASTGRITEDKPRSVVSHRLLADIAFEAGGNVTKASTGDPINGSDQKQKKRRRTYRGMSVENRKWQKNRNNKKV